MDLTLNLNNITAYYHSLNKEVIKMTNMSYCRFENTNRDLDDCIEALYDEEPLSKRERNQAKSMLKKMVEFLEDMDLLSDDDATFEEKIDEFIEGIKIDE